MHVARLVSALASRMEMADGRSIEISALLVSRSKREGESACLFRPLIFEFAEPPTKAAR